MSSLHYYTGIGSRKTPANILSQMTLLATVLSKMGIVLRSGGAPGADLAFERGANDNCEIYLPWKSFNTGFDRRCVYSNPSNNAILMASKYHPAWKRLSHGAQLLQGRNCHQVLGYDLNLPSDFVICWTPDGCESITTRSYNTGGTGTAISLADEYHIPIFNLRNESRYDDLLQFLETYVSSN